MPIAEILQNLEDEVFFAILDVALDLQGEVDVGNAVKVYIPFRRMLIRYEILCPANTPGIIERYCNLRWKACGFLKKHKVISNFHSDGNDMWDGLIEVSGIDSVALSGMVNALKAEENRRTRPGGPRSPALPSAGSRLVQLINTFHRVALKLQKRHANRAAFLIEDEYDVQDLLGALLETQFDDVRREEWGPSYAGGSTRADFLLKDGSILVETKMTREGLLDKQIGDQLLIDIAHYKQRSDVAGLICFVYDPDHRLRNPRGLEKDLSQNGDGFKVRVMVRPLR
jgi:hypothetical protein